MGKYEGLVIDFDKIAVLPGLYSQLLTEAGLPRKERARLVEIFTDRVFALTPKSQNEIRGIRNVCGACGVKPKDIGVIDGDGELMPNEWRR